MSVITSDQYEVAVKGGNVGYVEHNIRAEIVLGLNRGYGGKAHSKDIVLKFLDRIHDNKDRNYLAFIVQEATVCYAYEEDGRLIPEQEPALILTTDKSPMYMTHLGEEDWKSLVEWYASELGSEFDQSRIYVTYIQTEHKILQKIENPA